MTRNRMAILAVALIYLLFTSVSELVFDQLQKRLSTGVRRHSL